MGTSHADSEIRRRAPFGAELKYDLGNHCQPTKAVLVLGATTVLALDWPNPFLFLSLC